MVIIVNVFAITSAILFALKKIRPEPFLLGSLIWIFMLVAIWYLLPYSIYRKSHTFKDKFKIMFNEDGVRLENERGGVNWQWKQFTHYFETPEFFHLYFSSRAFFLLPKENISQDERHELRGMLGRKIGG
ncbi:MAG: YcxB family protein [Chitinophagaceae bacterium]|nr:YcxB family protein [Chitinophagaceae bacterium]